MARGKRTFSTLCDSCHSTWAPNNPHSSTKCEVHTAVSCCAVSVLRNCCLKVHHRGLGFQPHVLAQ